MRMCHPEHDIPEHAPCACRHNTTAAISVMERNDPVATNQYKVTLHNACPAHYAVVSTEWLPSIKFYEAFMRRDSLAETLVRRLAHEADAEEDRRKFSFQSERMAPRFDTPTPVVNLMAEIMEHDRQENTPGQRSMMTPV